MSETQIENKSKSRAGRYKKSNMTPEAWEKYLEKAKMYSKAYRAREKAKKTTIKQEKDRVYKLYQAGKLVEVDDSNKTD